MATAVDPQTILTDSEQLVATYQEFISDVVDQLTNFVNGRISYVTYPTAPVFTPTAYAPIPLGQLPALTPAVFGAEFGDPLSEIDRFYGHNFIAPLLDSVQQTLLGWITSGGVGISTDVQNALWNNNRARRQQSLQDAVDALHSKDANRGFAYFSGDYEENSLLIEYMQQDENLNYQITAKMAELAQQNVQFAVSQQVSIESLQASFSQGMAGVYLNLKRLIIEKFKIECDERIEEFKAQLEAIVAGYSLSETNGKLAISYQELLEKQWQVLMEQGTDRTKSLIQQSEEATRVQLQATETLVRTYSSMIQAALLQTNGISLSSATSSATQE
jgi:hypothetical protein